MRSIVVSRLGGPEVLEEAEVDTPRPGADELLVDIDAAGVNFMDIYQRIGRPPYVAPLPLVPGAEGAGTVAVVGANVTEFIVGDCVAWANAPHSYAEQVVVPARSAVKVPNGVDLNVAAAVMLQGLTAHYLCNSTYPVQEGDPVVVHAAAGGVGLLLVQLVKRRGGVVFATTSSGDKAKLARQAGADHTCDYDDVVEVVKQATGDAGAAAVFDGVGASTFETSLSTLRPRGSLVLFGGASGPVPPFDLARLGTSGSLYVTRPTLRDYIASRDELTSRSDELFTAIAQGALNVHIGATYSLAEARKAHEDLAARRTTGKLLLVP